MKILYDHQIFSFQKYGGISRYFIELYKNISNMGPIQPEISVIYTENSYYQELFHNKPLFSDINFSGKTVIVNKINEFKSKKKINKGDFDIFHPTYYNPYFLKFLKNKPYVLTIYDMIHELFPDMVRKDHTSFHKKMLIEHATKIIAISKNTKNDIIQFYNIDPAIIDIIPLATSLQIQDSDISIPLPQKYILFVGNRDSYKNFEFFITSIASLISCQKDLFLVCAGGGVFSNAEICLFKRLNLTNRVIYYHIMNDNVLSQFYQKAILFAFPSRYEGFGIPILEAFSCGCPVAASNSSSIPEVGGDAVIYFDPNNSSSIETVIGNIVKNKGLQDSLRIRGYERLKFFSWQRTAELTKAVYEDIINVTSHN
jgi:glycosyltransferase involved in cell wall biosynthesis